MPFMPTPTTTPLPITLTPVVNAVLALPTATVPTTGTVTGEITAEAPDVEASPIPETPTPPPAAPVASAPACAEPGASISSPGNGSQWRRQHHWHSHARKLPDLQKAKFAPGANATGGFVYLGGGNSPVQGGVLANVDTAARGPRPVDAASWSLTKRATSPTRAPLQLPWAASPRVAKPTGS